MNVRTKFTFWVALAAMLAATLMSVFVLREVREEAFELVDYELKDIADSFFQAIEQAANDSHTLAISKIKHPLDRFWLRLTTGEGEVIYETDLAKRIDLPVTKEEHSHIITHNIPLHYLWIPPDEMEDANELHSNSIRVQARFFQFEINGISYNLFIGRPLLLFDIEFREMIVELTSGIILTILIIFIVSYVITGRMLKPINVMNYQIRQIRESSLENRIPLGKSKDELHKLGVELNSMFDRLQYSFEKQREFIGNASHEMKSPLTILMIGHEELLMGDLPEHTRNELEKQLETMRRLNKLIRDLLSIARLEQEDKLQREHFSLNGLFHSILHDYEELIRVKGLRIIKIVPPIQINGDYEKILRLFINLIDNAIKYNLDTNGYIQIEAVKGNTNTTVQIVNSGQHIPDEDLLEIFNQFYRVEKSRAKTYGGTGLGLTIAKRIVEMHGGSINVANSEESINFTVVLPNTGEER